MTGPYRIPLAQPDLRGNEAAYILQALGRGQLTQGEFVQRFETEFAARLGVKHAITCSSGTTALHLALLAAGVKPGDRVLVPTLTYVATVAAVRYCGAIPVFADAEPDTWGMSQKAVRASDTPWYLPVHLYGVEGQVGCGAGIIEDAAEALGGTNDAGRPLGTHGHAGVFSFYGNKILTTGEGGMVVTDDDALAAEMRLLRGQGQSPARRYWHTRVGFNYRMTELSAAVGCAQLERLDEMLDMRRALDKRYRTALGGMLNTQTPRLGTTAAPWVFACLLPKWRHAKRPQDNTYPREYPAFRDQVMATLAAEGIETRPTFPCVHEMPPYRQYVRLPGMDGGGLEASRAFPIAEDISRRGLLLPLHSQMTLADVDDVCDHLRRLL